MILINLKAHNSFNLNIIFNINMSIIEAFNPFLKETWKVMWSEAKPRATVYNFP